MDHPYRARGRGAIAGISPSLSRMFDHMTCGRPAAVFKTSRASTIESAMRNDLRCVVARDFRIFFPSLGLDGVNCATARNIGGT